MCNIYDDNSMYQRFSSYDEDQEDCDFFKSLYPLSLTDMQRCVEARCDELEYVGSMMFDKYPDRVRIEKMAKDMCVERKEFDDKMIQVMLVNEMLRRRIRKRNCRGRGFC